MACGTPVLATSVGGVPDLIKDGNIGFIMKDNTPECVAENVIRALEHPNLEKIVKNARALVERGFTYETVVERYRKIVENCSKYSGVKMRIMYFGGFIDYQIQLANALSKKNTVMLVIPANKLPSEYLGSGEAV